MRAILSTPPNDEALARLLADSTYNSILHTTCVATMLDGGHAPNGLPQRAGANVNCRIFPGVPQEDVRNVLERVVDDPQIRISFANEPEEVSPPPPLTKAVLGPIETITEKMWPDIPVIPNMTPTGTDGRFLTPKGIPTYGVSGIFADPETTHTHGLNERVKVGSLYEGREFLDQLIRIYADRP
jgi:acetylornithine deacetylase/succinyl-diaminopimelate desuccinylase-like protein